MPALAPQRPSLEATWLRYVITTTGEPKGTGQLYHPVNVAGPHLNTPFAIMFDPTKQSRETYEFRENKPANAYLARPCQGTVPASHSAIRVIPIRLASIEWF